MSIDLFCYIIWRSDCDMDLDEECYSCVNRHGGNEYLEYMSGTWSVYTSLCL